MVSLAGRPLDKPTGYGLMGLTWRASPPTQEQAFKAMKEALNQGANFWNGGELYGSPERNSLHLLNEYFTKYPEDADRVIISIKGAGPDGTVKTFSGDADNTRRSIQQCLDVLGGTKKLDIWEAARVDPKTPIEVTMRAAKEFVDSGKLGGISLSECSADTIRRAAKVATIVAVEVEVSVWATEIWDNGVAAACAELGIPIVAYSPLGRGFLTGEIRKPSDIPKDDMRSHLPRFQGEAFEANLEIVKQVEKIAEKRGCKPGQVGLGWLRAKSGKLGNPVIIPIPGATTVERIQENSADITLTDAEVDAVDEIIKSITVQGERYAGDVNKLNFGDSPKEESS